MGMLLAWRSAMFGAAPNLVSDNLLLLKTSAGQPLVLVFAGDWTEPNREILEGIRAELRGLGAALLIVSKDWLFFFRADDELEAIGQTTSVGPSLERLFARHGLSPNVLVSEGMTLALLDGDGGLRFRRTIAGPAAVADSLLLALQLAGADVARASRGPRQGQVSRREVVTLSLLGSLALVLAEACKHKTPAPVAAPPPPVATHEVPVELNINGKVHALKLEPRVSLLDTLRERLGLTGTKKGCDHGQCGACTVLVDGRRVNACLTLAIMAQKKPIITIEGLAEGEQLHALQHAFISEDALQCGYCTPGQIMSAAGLLKENRARSDDQVREQMSGNICRCGAYANIVRAIQSARGPVPA
jgi:xanthine dehydrogenase YagT iron-sulfur-binding subunit